MPTQRHRREPAIRIVVADDQAIVRRGLVMMLESQPDFEVVGEAASERETLEACQRLRPDVMVLDVRMPSDGSLSIVEAVAGVSPSTRVLAVAERGEARCLALNPPRPGEDWDPRRAAGCEPVSDCLQLAVLRGVHGTIRSDARPEDLFRAVRSLGAGHTSYDAGTASRLRARALAGERRTGLAALTSRELEVASLIGEGWSNKEIARGLEISEPTVKKHVGRVLAKLELQDRLQVGLYLARNPQALAPASARSAPQRTRTMRRTRTRPPTSTRAR